jgi:hypothetical protein
MERNGDFLMKHLRQDYMRIQDPALHDGRLLSKGSTPIGEDEPVFLLRGKDAIAPSAVRHWANLLISCTDPPSGDRVVLYQAAMRWADEMEQWQARNGCKTPDAPVDQLRAATRFTVGATVAEEPAEGPGEPHRKPWEPEQGTEGEADAWPGEPEEYQGDVRVTVELPVSHAAELIATIARCVSANKIEYNYEDTARRPRRTHGS